MHKLLLFLLASSAFAAPTVTILGLTAQSHSSVSVVFTISSPGNAARAHTSPPNGTCENTSAGVYSTQMRPGVAGGLNNRKVMPFDNQDTAPIRSQLMFFNLLPNTNYRLCPEVSDDAGASWSSGVGIPFTTSALPAVHPALPIPPETFEAITGTTVPSMPNLANYQVLSPDCGSLVNTIQSAANNLLTTGSIVNVPNCSNINILFHNQFPDHIDFTEANMDVANNELVGPSYPQSAGGNCGSGVGQIPCLAEGMRVKLGVPAAYDFNLPYNLHDYGYNSNNTVPYLFYIHLRTGDPSRVQLYYPKPYSQCPSCLWTLGDNGSGNGRIVSMVEFPRPLKWLVLRTPTPDSQFAAAGTRVTPAWDSKMAFLNGFNFSTNEPGDDRQVNAGNIYVMGIHFKVPPTGEISPQPVTYGGLLTVHQDSGPVVFDRCHWEGPDFPDRITTFAGDFNGAFVAMINSYIDKMNYWHASSTWYGLVPYGNPPGQPPGANSGIVNTVGGTTFQIGPGHIAGGAFSCTQNGTMHVQLHGTPANGGAIRGFVVCNADGTESVMIDPAMAGTTTDIGTVVPGPTSYNGQNDLNSPLLPRDNRGRASTMPIAMFDVIGDGTVHYLAPAEVYESSNDTTGGEGSDTFVLGRGPGPSEWVNNYIQVQGNTIHYDDCLNAVDCRHDIGDDLIYRNFFFTDYNKIRSGPGFDGNVFVTRHALEWKHGQRSKVYGNIFYGPAGSDAKDNTGTTILHKTAAGTVTDGDVQYNTITQSTGFAAAGTFYNTNHYPGDTMARMRFSNNIIQDINAWKFSSYLGLTAPSYHGGNGWGIQWNGAAEDIIFSHNTFLPSDGMKPLLFALKEPAEGIQIDNNVLGYSSNNNTGGMFAMSDQGVDAMAVPTNQGSTCNDGQLDKALMNCLWSQYSFKGNAIIPGYNSNNVIGSTCDNGGSGDGCFNRRNQFGNTQVPVSQICTGLGETYSNGQCSNVNNYIVNQPGGVDASLASIGIRRPSADFAGLGTLATDYRMKTNSLFISGGTRKGTDGKDVGADIDTLESVQGKVSLIGTPSNTITATGAVVAFIAPDTQACPIDVSGSDPLVIASFSRFPDTGTATRIRNVPVTGLTANTVYHYRVNCAVEQPTGAFITKK